MGPNLHCSQVPVIYPRHSGPVEKVLCTSPARSCNDCGDNANWILLLEERDLGEQRRHGMGIDNISHKMYVCKVCHVVVKPIFVWLDLNWPYVPDAKEIIKELTNPGAWHLSCASSASRCSTASFRSRFSFFSFSHSACILFVYSMSSSWSA